MVKYRLVDTLLYQSEEGAVERKFIIGDETLWASRKVVAEIFATTGPNISMHFENIVREGELEKMKCSDRFKTSCSSQITTNLMRKLKSFYYNMNQLLLYEY
ncbi:hypothetical protein [Methanobrevibacter sp.]|uniref:hypothetical protein n=1 Tax=Methanobrevibacter sp. TaxID=66852 RepID=UPI0026DFDB03|nr:hypothetical protein [Methanobrevibacter sp.]